MEKKNLEVGDLIKRVTPYATTLIRVKRVTKTEAVAINEELGGKYRYKKEYIITKNNKEDKEIEIVLTTVPYTPWSLTRYYLIKNE